MPNSEKKKNKRQKAEEYFLLVLGVTLLAMSTIIFFNPNQIVVGGVTGIGILIENYSLSIFSFRIPVSVTNIVLNIPLFTIGYRVFGKEFISKTMLATAILSLMMTVMEFLPKYQGDLILIAVFGAILQGIGVGLVLRGYATTGGTDLLASIIHKKHNHIPVSTILFTVDAVIVAIGFFMFGGEKAMYAIIAIYISSKCINTVLEGTNFSKVALIISENSDEISVEIMKKIDRGVTSINGKGMYTGLPRNILLCVFSQKEITKVKDIVQEVDKDAFLLVHDVREVMGNGFNSISERKIS